MHMSFTSIKAVPLNMVGENLSDSAPSGVSMTVERIWHRQITDPPSDIGMLIQAILLMSPQTTFTVKRNGLTLTIEAID